MALGTYQFSVGTLLVSNEDGDSTNEVALMTEIGVSYDGDPQSLYGGDYRLPVAIELGNRSGEVTAMSTRWQIADTVLTNDYVTCFFGFGANSGGLSGSIQGCKLSNYSVTSTQNDYVMSDLTFTIGDPNHMDKGSTPPGWS